MINENTYKIKNILNCTGKSAAEMTHSLSQLGDGNMSDGMVALWKDGQRNGVAKGAALATVVLTIAFGIRELVKNNISEAQTKQAIKEIFSPHKAPAVFTNEVIAPKSADCYPQQPPVDICINTSEDE